MTVQLNHTLGMVQINCEDQGMDRNELRAWSQDSLIEALIAAISVRNGALQRMFEAQRERDEASAG